MPNLQPSVYHTPQKHDAGQFPTYSAFSPAPPPSPEKKNKKKILKKRISTATLLPLQLYFPEA